LRTTLPRMPMPGAAGSAIALEMPGGDEANNMADESTLAAMVQSQGVQLLAQEKRIQALEEQLKRVLANQGVEPKMGELKGDMAEDGKEGVVAVEVVDAMQETTERESALYDFEQSLWDAALLLFFRATNYVDKTILCIGLIINFCLQSALLLTVYMDMLESPYTPEKVEEMLNWRVNIAHSAPEFNDASGESRLARLCKHELWSYEQEEYSRMYDYLYMPMPGTILSTLAIIMWLLTIMVEYRRCVEQALAVIHLPALSVKDEFVVTNAEGQLVLHGIQPLMRVLALLLLSLPRLFVMFFLAIIGCQYLAQTVNLQDIVLNAVALAFVLDVDELVADVLLTERLRSMVAKIQPLSCGLMKTGRCCPLKDTVRYVITGGLVAFALIHFLLPFDENVRGAAMALCGGFQDFSYTGGVAESPSIQLKPREFGSDQWVSSCFSDEGDTHDAYLQKYYGGRHNSSFFGNASQTVTANYYDRVRQQEILTFAYGSYQSFGDSYTGCEEDHILGPQDKVSGARSCVRIPSTLAASLQNTGAQGGRRKAPPDCPRFNVTDGCIDIANPDVCVWSWLSQKCDQNWPGDIQAQACTFDEPIASCDVWEGVFSRPHPVVNCEVRSCPDTNYNCLGLRFQYIVKPTDWLGGDTQWVDILRGVMLRRAGIPDASLNYPYVVNARQYSASNPARTYLVTFCMINLPFKYKALQDVSQTDSILAEVLEDPAYDATNGVESITSSDRPNWAYYLTSYLSGQWYTDLCSPTL